MDLADIQRLAIAARQFQAEPLAAGRVNATLQIPTRHEVKLEMRRAGGNDDAGSLVILERAMLQGFLVGWSGVLIKDVLPGHPNDDALPFEPAAVPLLLDAQPEWADAWSVQLFARMRAYREQQETAEKN